MLGRPYVCSSGAEIALGSLDPSVLDLLNNVFEIRLAGEDVDRIEVTQAGSPGSKGVVFTVYVRGDRTQALVVWFGIDGEIEMSEDRLKPRARRQLAEHVAIKVEALD